jgi:hypothetical protein
MFFKNKLTWRRPLFYVLLPVFFVMVFLGFPLPIAPPPATKARQEESAPIQKKKQFDPALHHDDGDWPSSSDRPA